MHNDAWEVVSCVDKLRDCSTSSRPLLLPTVSAESNQVPVIAKAFGWLSPVEAAIAKPIPGAVSGSLFAVCKTQASNKFQREP